MDQNKQEKFWIGDILEYNGFRMLLDPGFKKVKVVDVIRQTDTEGEYISYKLQSLENNQEKEYVQAFVLNSYLKV